MKIHNIFMVTSPLQLMNAIEAIEHFKTHKNILVILYMERKSLSQIKKLIDFIDWEMIKYIPLPKSNRDRLFFAKTVHDRLKEIKKREVNSIFVGDYKSAHLNHVVNFFKTQKIYLLDDGLAQLNYHHEMRNETYKVKIRSMIYKLLFYKLDVIDYTFFTIFNIPNEKVIKNNYDFFKKNIQSKEIKNSVYFIGQPLVELEIMSVENHKKELVKIINFYKAKDFIYVLHRRENEEHIQQLALELDFEYKVFDTLIELEMINALFIPSDFATFFSTAIVTLPNFIKNAEYRVFKSQEYNDEFKEHIFNAYKSLEEMSLRVEEL